MTIESYGYAGPVGGPGLIMPNDALAYWQMSLGSRWYWVYAHDHCVPSANMTGTRQVDVSTGWMGGLGITDHVTATETITLPSVSSGIRYFWIYARRTWQTTQATTIVYEDAGTTLPTSLSAVRNTSRGTIDDQPLALFSLSANDTRPVLVNDVRMWGGNENFNAYPMAQNFLAYNAYEGNTVRFTDGRTFRRLTSPTSGNAFWDVDPEVVQSGPGLGNGLGITDIAGWLTTTKLESRGTRTGNDMKLLLQANHANNIGPITFTDVYGAVNGGDTTILTVGNVAWRPPYDIPAVAFTYLSADNSTYTGHAIYTTDGRFVVTDGVQGTSIGARPDGSWSLRALVTWTRQ